MFIKNWKKELLTIPNLLSLFRLILIPVYMTVYFRAKTVEDYCLAAGILAVSCMTDAVDGKIARHFNMISTVGKILDPIADKATQFTLIYCLARNYPILWLLLTLFIIKEGFQLIAGCINLRQGRMLTGALMSGKICTTLLFVSMILLVLFPDMPQTLIYIITAVDCISLLAAFVSYIRVYSNADSPMIADFPKEDQ